MKISELGGLVAILPTPLAEDGTIDEAGVRALARSAVDKGLDGVVVLGSNGEFPYLSFEEKVRVMGAAAEAVDKRVPVIGTASAWSTREALALAREAGRCGCDAVMAALPLYFDLDFEDAVSHFDALARGGGLPVFYYHFPEVTGLRASPARLAEISAIDGVVGAKLTVINRPFLKKTIEATRSHEFRVFTGSSLLLLDCLEAGGAGAFCPLPLIATKDVKSVCERLAAGDGAGARTVQDRLKRSIPLFTGSRLSPALLARGFEILVRLPHRTGKRAFASQGLLKEALRQQGHPISSRVRRPHRAVGEAERELVRSLLAEMGWR